MAFVVKDRVKQSTTTTGTGSIVLNGTVSGFQTFTNALSDGDTTYYAIFEVSTNEWEVGVGTWTESTTTLARTTVLASSNSNSAIDLSAQAEVFITQPAGKAAFFDPSGDLTLVQDPTSNLQAATKQYVDTIAAAGLHYHDPVRVEQEGNLSATYSNGTAGVGATLTNNSTQAALTIDGVALSLNDRVLIYEQTNGYENGIYTVTNVGSASTNWVLTRATDADSYAPSDPDSLGQGDAFFVLEGTAGAGELYVMNTEGTITFGTTNITFTQVAATAVYTAGTGLTLTGTEFAADGANITNVDAVTLDGIDSSQFLRSDTVDTKTAGNLNFSDNVKAVFGDGSDLEIYHSGTASVIHDNGTGNLELRAGSFRLKNGANTAFLMKADVGGAASLFHNGSEKFATTSTGIDVTGTVTADGLTTSGDILLSKSGETFIYNSVAGTDSLRLGGAAELTLQTYSGAWADRLNIASNGDISFYEDTGTTAKFFWDASAEVLGIGTTSPNTNSQLNVDGGSSDGSIRIDGGTNTKLTSIAANTGSNFIYLGDTDSYQSGFIRYQHSNDLMTLKSTDDINFVTSGAERMRITSAGNVGIGATPNAYQNFRYLTLQGGATNQGGVYETQTSNSSGKATWYTTNSGTVFGSTTTTDLLLLTDNVERMRINSSGNVGIGTTSPRENLTVENTNLADNGQQAFIRHNQYWNGSATVVENSSYGTVQIGLNRQGGGHLTFETGGVNTTSSEKARIDSSGNLLVGTTTNDTWYTSSNEGHNLNSNNFLAVARNGGPSIIANRLGTDGAAYEVRKSGTIVGSIGSAAGSRLFIGSGDTGVRFAGDLDTIVPWNTNNTLRDAAIDLGEATGRFKDLYLSGVMKTGTNQRTSFGQAGFWDNATDGNNVGVRLGGAHMYLTDGNGSVTNKTRDIGRYDRRIRTLYAGSTLDVEHNADNAGVKTTLKALHTSNNTLEIHQFGQSHANAPAVNQIGVSNAEQHLHLVTDASATVDAGTSTKGIFLRSGGNVGIGTQSPSTILHVNGGSGGWGIFERNSKQLYINANYSAQNNYAQVATRGSDSMGLSLSSNDGNPEYMFINTSGNVGIGTTSPNTALGVKRTSGTATIRVHADHTANSRAAIEFMRGTTDTFGGDAYTDWKLGQVGATQADFAIISHDTTRGSNERLTLEYNTGNVGIGVTTPDEKLDVNGDTRIRGSGSTMAGATMANASLLVGSTTSGIGIDPNEIIAAGDSLYLGGLTNGVVFRVGANQHGAMDSSGNFGFGTTSPSQKLHVQGGQVRVSNGSDFYINSTSSNSYAYTSSTPFDIYTSGVNRFRFGTTGYLSIFGATAPETHAYLNIGSAGSSQTRAIDIDGGWSGNESKAISFTYGAGFSNMVGQWDVQHNGPASRMRWGKLYHGADSSTYTMELVSTSTTTADLTVLGSISATSKSFVIDHPTKEGMKLRYGSLEGPEDGVYVRGRLTGKTVIELPDYWTGLVHEDSITVQLTAMGGKADLWVESIADNKVTVGCGTEVDCFYFVQATRKDVDAWDVEYVADS